jgi:uncharacterized delta-60 repeat protein
MATALLVGAILLAGLAPASATGTSEPGDLDPSFSGNGLVLLLTGSALGVVPTADGGSFVSLAPYGRWRVTKLNTGGLPDTSFAGDGTATFDLPFLYGPEVAVTHGGGIVGAGTHYDSDGVPRTYIRVVRVSDRGRRLRSFGKHGVVRLDPFPRPGVVTGVVVQPSGRIVVGGYFQHGPHARGTTSFLLGLTPSGALDPGFGDGGLVTPDLGRISRILALAMTTSGRPVGVGMTAAPRPATWPVALAARWRVNGSIDRSFGDRGIVRWPGSGTAEEIAIAPDGDVIAGGWLATAEAALMRLTPDGVIDPSFGDGGTATVPGRSVDGLVVQADGSALGVTWSRDSDVDVLITRIDPNGMIDSSFGDGGTSRLAREGDDLPRDAALDRAGRLLVGGYTHGSSARAAFVARILT